MALNVLQTLYVKEASKEIGIHPAFGLAIIDKESAGVSLYKINGEDMPAIRIEGHHFYKNLSGKQRDEAVAQGLADKRVGGIKNPKTMAGRYTMLKRMVEINAAAAYKSVSYGLGQIMGFNYSAAGFESAYALFQASRTFNGQVDAMFNFIKNTPNIYKAAVATNFKAFAKAYNGPAAPASYAVELERLYTTWKDTGNTSVKDLQPISSPNKEWVARIRALGFNDVMSFQSSRSIKVDSAIGPITRSEIEAAEKERKARQNAPIVAASKIGGAAFGVATAAASAESPEIVRSLVESTAPVIDLVKTLAPMGAPILYAGAGAVAVWAIYKIVTKWLGNRAANTSN
jgi:N-acetylmuramidase